MPSSTSLSAQSRFVRLAAITIVATLAVIAWGAYVRASGSGAGCGDHWPTCNGTIIPRAPSTKTLVELTHRITSGMVFFLVFAQMLLALRRFPRAHPVRRLAAISFVLIITEALVGAGLVIFKMVAGNDSTARAGWMSAHLLNTFALLAALVLTWWRARAAVSGWTPAAPADAQGWPRRFSSIALGLLVLTATSGAVAALGDTLFPAESLRAGLIQDLSPAAHLFLRLRVLHPVVAVIAGLVSLAGLAAIVNRRDLDQTRRAATLASGLVLAQLTAGVVNLVLLAPIPLQLIHLLLADLLWMAMIVVHATLRSNQATSRATSESHA